MGTPIRKNSAYFEKLLDHCMIDPDLMEQYIRSDLRKKRPTKLSFRQKTIVLTLVTIHKLLFKLIHYGATEEQPELWEELKSTLLSLPNTRDGSDERLRSSAKEDIVTKITFSVIPHYMFDLYREEHKKTIIFIFRKNGRAVMEPKQGIEKNELLSRKKYGEWAEIYDKLEELVKKTFLNKKTKGIL